jgi:hypothetical protein
MFMVTPHTPPYGLDQQVQRLNMLRAAERISCRCILSDGTQAASNYGYVYM